MWWIRNEGTRKYSKSACTYGINEQVSQSPQLAKSTEIMKEQRNSVLQFQLELALP